jgi:Ring finger domain
LPDIESNVLEVQTPGDDEEPIYQEAIFLSKHIIKLLKAATTISQKIKSYIARKTLRRFIVLKKADQLPDCAICHDRLEPSLSIFTECDHLFHTNCIQQWFTVRRTCPLCNTVL